MAATDELVETFTTVNVGLHHLGMYVLRHIPDGLHSGAAAAHNEEVFHLGIVHLASDVAQIVDIFLRGHKIGHIARLHTVIAVGNDGFGPTFDGYDVVWRLRTAKAAERHVEDVGIFAHLDAKHEEGAVLDFKPLAHPTVAGVVHDFASGKHLWIDDRVDANGFEEVAMFRTCVFIIVNTRHSLRSSELGGEHATRHIVCLVGGDADEEVGLAHIGPFEGFDGRGGIADG